MVVVVAKSCVLQSTVSFGRVASMHISNLRGVDNQIKLLVLQAHIIHAIRHAGLSFGVIR